MRADSLSSTEEVNQLSTSTSRWIFSQEYVCERDRVFYASSLMDPEMPWFEEGQISLQSLNVCSSFISQDERMSEFSVKTLQKALGLHLISKRGLRYLWHIERHAQFTASNVDDAWEFLNIVRNSNISVSTRKWPSVSLLTSRSAFNVLTSLV